MKKKRIEIRQFVERLEQIQVRMNEITDLCEKENRARNDAENTEFETLRRESGIINARIQAANVNGGFVDVTDQAAAFDSFLRSATQNGTQSVNSQVLKRDFVGQTVANSVAAVPLTIGDIVKPLEAGLIYDKVGIPLLTGLQGEYCWPVVGTVEASIADEAVELADSKIDIEALKPTPVRLGISIDVTNQTINQTTGIVLQIVQQQMPLAVARLINRCMFITSTTAKGYNKKFHGPFVDCKNKVTFAADVPTYKELLQMRGKVFAEGVENDGTGAYIMNAETAAILEATPRDTGSGLMIIEDGKIGGFPVFQTSHIDGIGFGVWGLDPLGQVGDIRFIVDPYSKAGADVTRLTVNADWSMSTLRKEAFVLGSFPQKL